VRTAAVRAGLSKTQNRGGEYCRETGMWETRSRGEAVSDQHGPPRRFSLKGIKHWTVWGRGVDTSIPAGTQNCE